MPRASATSKSKFKYAKDDFGKDILLKDNETPVMMEWEKPYVEASIEAIHPKGADVLEIGFALGYAADRIQRLQPKSHTIIESEPLVIARAKEWAKQQKADVKIVEGKWQDVLSKLGKFDAIYLNDYLPVEPEEIKKLMEQTEQYDEATEEAVSLREALADSLKQWRGHKFSDEEIRAFGKQISKRAGVTMRDVLDFMDYLEEMEHITSKQKAAFAKEFKADATSRSMPKGTAGKPSHEMNKAFLGNRFLTFTETCLDWHMRPGARLSAYIGSGQSKKEDPDFKERILSRKVNYTEKTIPVTVPPNCHYFQGNKALVILLEKK